ncbi:meteorin-like protein [Ascaphus truei]|uniref:meteorin-like protein n=1 Tax=Ascaphus truei TaxID=8439 RepID=UPI003F5AD03C
MQKQRLGDLVLLCLLLMLGGKLGCAADHCSWKGSGLGRDAHSRAVQLVHLRCTEGSLVWMYPTRALRVILAPNLASGKHKTVCIKPSPNFKGASIYVERDGELHFLVNEGDGVRQVHCFSTDSTQRVVLFLQASLQKDISRRTAGFQYEVLSNHSSSPGIQKFAVVEALCRPCDNVELLMAICSSDFVVRGSIGDVSHDAENHVSQVEVRAVTVYRQRNGIFQQDDATGEWTAPIKTLLQCRVKKGEGDFLFTGNEHFGDAWLGCAPRFKDFRLIYREAREQRTHPCEFQLD